MPTPSSISPAASSGASSSAFSGISHVIILHNPLSGRHSQRRLKKIITLLQRQQVKVTDYKVYDLADIRNATQRALSATPDLIIAAGGDGTINQIATQLCHHQIPLAVLPFGTANVLAHSLGLPTKASALANYLLTGHAKTAHMGKIDTSLFLCMASIGVDAEVVAHMTPDIKHRWGKVAYLHGALKALLRPRYQSYQFMIDGQKHSAYGLIITNVSHYGGPYCLAPEQSLLNPCLTAVLITAPGRRTLMRILYDLWAGHIQKNPDITYIHCQHIDITSPHAAPIQADGDHLTAIPAAISTEPGLILWLPAHLAENK